MHLLCLQQASLSFLSPALSVSVLEWLLLKASETCNHTLTLLRYHSGEKRETQQREFVFFHVHPLTSQVGAKYNYVLNMNI